MMTLWADCMRVAQQSYPAKPWGGWLAEAGDAVVSIFFPLTADLVNAC
jgi:hypothetical protein